MAIRSITRRPPAATDPERKAEQDHEVEDHDRGLAFDLPRIVDRRRALGFLVGGVGAAALVACGSSSSDSSSTTSAAGDTSSSSGDSSSSTSTESTGSADGTTEVPDETGGPFPGDGSNGPNALTESGVVRRDITTSFGGSSGTAEGVATTVTMTLLDVSAGGTPLAGAAVYIWHCDRDGEYSMYGDVIADQNFLRGVQEADAAGTVTFQTIYPGAYAGRWPHIHFEVYADLDTATSAGSKLKTSQVALPEATSAEVYATTGYEQSVTNLAQTSLDSDMVFSDGYASQLATASGSVADGLTMTLNVGV